MFSLVFASALISLSAGSVLQRPSTEPPLIPRQVLFGNADYSHVSLSPDGEWLAYLAPSHGVPNIWVRHLVGENVDNLLTFDRKRGVSAFVWAFDNKHILYVNDNEGDENWRIFKANVRENTTTTVVDTLGVQAKIVRLSEKRPTLMVIGLNDVDPRYHDLYLVDIETGNKSLLFNNSGQFDSGSFVFDRQLNLRFASKTRKDAGKELFRRDLNTSVWTLFRELDRDDIGTDILGFNVNQTRLYWLETVGRDKLTLTSAEVDNYTSADVLYVPKKADLGDVLFHPRTKLPLIVYENYMRTNMHIIDASMKEHIDFLRKAVSKNEKVDVDITATSLSFDTWIVVASSDVIPVRYYIYKPEGKNLTFLFHAKKRLAAYTFVPMQAVEITTNDSLVEVCYMVLPAGVDLRKKRLPPKPLPLLLYVHGGPWSRDSYGFDNYAQWVANRGYAYLSCNFRGSSGYGKSFLNKGNGEWGRKMQTDLSDAIDWTIEKGLVDRTKVAIMGGSYGGYAVLAGLAFTPDVYACGVDIVGPSNLLTLMSSIPAYWESGRAQLIYRIGGDPSTPEGQQFLRERSPLFSADQISKPLLIAQGANDPRVKKAESDQIVSAMKKRGTSVSYIIFPDEGHGFVRPPNSIANLAVTEKFLKQCLGGRAEKVGNAVEKSTLKLVEGDKGLLADENV